MNYLTFMKLYNKWNLPWDSYMHGTDTEVLGLMFPCDQLSLRTEAWCPPTHPCYFIQSLSARSNARGFFFLKDQHNSLVCKNHRVKHSTLTSAKN